MVPRTLLGFFRLSMPLLLRCPFNTKLFFSSGFRVQCQSSLSPASYSPTSPSNDYIHCSSLRALQSISANDLVVYPSFLDQNEQRILLAASLLKLDSMAGREERKRKKDWMRSRGGMAMAMDKDWNYLQGDSVIQVI